jgi:outer membrane protein, heavy metal efflux system
MQKLKIKNQNYGIALWAMTSSILHFALCILIFLSGCAGPEQQKPQWKPLDTSTLTEPLTLEKCLQLARQNDLQVAQWKARLNIADAELFGAKELPNPTFGLTWDDIGLHDEEGVNISSLEYGVSYPIFFWLPRGNKIAAARANRRAEIETVLSEQRQLTVEIASAYFNLVADQRKVQILENLLQLTAESFRLVSKQKELQIASDYDLDRIRAEQLKAESDLLDARSQLRLDQLAFAFALGADKPFYPVVEDCNDTIIQSLKDVVSDTNTPDSVIQQALQASPDWKAKQAAVIAAQEQLKVENLDSVPLADSSVSGGPKDSPEGWGSIFSFEIPIPLFNWNRSGIAKAKAELAAAQTQQEKARRDTVAAVSSAWQRYRTLATRWNQYTKVINELAQKNEQSASKLFTAGQIEYNELLIAQRDNRQAQLDALSTWQDTSTAAWVLSCVLGQHDVPSQLPDKK